MTNEVSTNTAVKRAIIDELRAADIITVARHFRPDGDAIGSTFGLVEILRATWPEKKVYFLNEDVSDYVAFLGDEGEAPDDETVRNSVCVCVDCGTVDRLSSKRTQLAKKIVKIDHHIDDKPYGDLSWVEDSRSSACEMIVDLWLTFRDELTITHRAVNCLYCGMVTDSGRFKYDGTGAETLRCAAALLEEGVDTEWLYAHLYTDDPAELRYRAEAMRRMKMTESGVAWIRITNKFREKMGMTQEQASTVIGEMDSIRGSLIWLAFLENDDGSIRVRLRSRFVGVQELATRYHGGGHFCASGGTVYSQKEMKALIADADKLLHDYKETHEGWL